MPSNQRFCLVKPNSSQSTNKTGQNNTERHSKTKINLEDSSTVTSENIRVGRTQSTRSNQNVASNTSSSVRATTPHKSSGTPVAYRIKKKPMLLPVSPPKNQPINTIIKERSSITTDTPIFYPSSQLIGTKLTKQDVISTKGVIDREVEQFIQTKMFPKIKFIVNDMMMNYSTEKNSSCQIILTGINCAVENGQLFWNTY